MSLLSCFSLARARDTAAANAWGEHISMESSLRSKKPAKVQYGRRARLNGSSPAQAVPELLEAASSSSDTSKVDVKVAPPTSPTRGTRANVTPNELSRVSRSRTASPQKLPTTPSPFAKASLSASTSKLPPRLPRSGSPSLDSSSRFLKRSASTSPQKLSERTTPNALSPRKGLVRSKTPTRPAKDLGSLFDAIGTEPRTLFARSESHPVIRLSDSDSPSKSPALPQQPQSPTLGLGGLPDSDVLTSPTKRARLMERMAPRTAKAVNNGTKADTDNPFSRHGSLRKTETDPQVSLQPHKDEDEHSAQASDKAFDHDETPTLESQENIGIVNRRLAGIKQVAATNAKRTYGLQRSFLVDQAEENLLAETNIQPPSASIEDEIESQLQDQRGLGLQHRSAEASSSRRPAAPLAAAAPPRESYAELLRRWGEGADDIEWDESQDPTLNLKSITSLRSVGELRRFNDDLEYLFSGMEATQPISVRRSSALELVRLLCGNPDTDEIDDHSTHQGIEDGLSAAQSAEFLRKLKATDSIVRVYDHFKVAQAGNGLDDVLDAAFAICLAKLLRTPGNAESLIRERWSPLLESLTQMLTRASRTSQHKLMDGFALLRLHDLGHHQITARAQRNSLTELRAIARASSLFVAASSNLTLRNLLLGAVCSLMALPRRLLTDTVILDILRDAETEQSNAPSLFTIVLGTLKQEGAKCGQRLVDYSKGLELQSNSTIETAPDLDAVDLCIRFMDKGMDLLYIELDRAVEADEALFESLLDIAVLCIQASDYGAANLTHRVSGKEESDGSKTLQTSDRALQVTHGLFKLLLDLSQVDPNWGDMQAASGRLHEDLLRALLLSHECAVNLRKHMLSTSTKTSDGVTDTADQDTLVSETGDRSATLADAGSQLRLALALRQDVVHLALAVITNLLIKKPDKARTTLSGIAVNPKCWHRRPCALTCKCGDAATSVELLARLFLETRGSAMMNDDSEAAYLSNSVATALAQFAVGGGEHLSLCRRTLDAQALALTARPPLSEADFAPVNGFDTLLEAVDEFAVIHEAAFHLEQQTVSSATAAAETPAEEAGQLIKDLAGTLRSMAA